MLASIQEILDYLERQASLRADENDEKGILMDARQNILANCKGLDPEAYGELQMSADRWQWTPIGLDYQLGFILKRVGSIRMALARGDTNRANAAFAQLKEAVEHIDGHDDWPERREE